MFSTKTLTRLAYVLALAADAVHAQPKPVVPHASSAGTHVAVPAADIDMGMTSASAVPVATASQPPGQAAAQRVVATPPAAPAVPHLSIEDVDQITRQKIVRQLSGGSGGADSGVALNAPVSGAPAVVVKPAPQAVLPTFTQDRARAEPVRFVGAFSDMTGKSVLYEYRKASYPAHVGTKLLNGWTVSRVEGFVVTVTEGKRTWTETIVGGSNDADVNDTKVAAFVPGRQLNDLGGPLPPAMQPSMGR